MKYYTRIRTLEKKPQAGDRPDPRLIALVEQYATGTISEEEFVERSAEFPEHESSDVLYFDEKGELIWNG